jgi:RimJ/RimL family protein N-acetyltransferase
MATTIPNIETYPKHFLLRDGTEVILRPLVEEDEFRLLEFFRRIPQGERYYLKENVASPEVIQRWISNLDFRRVIPIIALAGDQIVADATLHRSRSRARHHIAEIRIVVDPDYREVGLGRRLIQELLDIAVMLGLDKVIFQLVAQREEAAIAAAGSMRFREVAVLKEWLRDIVGEYQDLVIMEMPLENHRLSSWF